MGLRLGIDSGLSSASTARSGPAVPAHSTCPATDQGALLHSPSLWPAWGGGRAGGLIVTDQAQLEAPRVRIPAKGGTGPVGPKGPGPVHQVLLSTGGTPCGTGLSVYSEPHRNINRSIPTNPIYLTWQTT